MFGLKSWKIFILLITSLKCFKIKKMETFINSQVAFFKTSGNVDSGVSSREWKGLGTWICLCSWLKMDLRERDIHAACLCAVKVSALMTPTGYICWISLQGGEQWRRVIHLSIL